MAEADFPIIEGRETVYQLVHFIRRDLTHDSDLSGLIGVLPYNALVFAIECYVTQAFSNSKLSIGKGGDDKTFGEKEIKSVSIQNFSITADKALVKADEELRLHYKIDQKSNAGKCVILVKYVPKL